MCSCTAPVKELELPVAVTGISSKFDFPFPSFFFDAK
jgi:hypothetical protein